LGHLALLINYREEPVGSFFLGKKMRASKNTIIIIMIILTVSTLIGIHFVLSVHTDNKPAAAIMLSSLLAIVGASFNIYFQRKSNKESNALSFQLNLSTDTSYKNSFSTVIAAIENRADISILSYVNPESDIEKANAAAISEVLNTWERAANAMRHGVYDESYLYNSHKSTVLHLGVYLREYIRARQLHNISYFSNLNWLIIKWSVKRDSFESKNTKMELKRIFNDLDRIKHGRIPHYKK
jgi:hypothetical protein